MASRSCCAVNNLLLLLLALPVTCLLFTALLFLLFTTACGPAFELELAIGEVVESELGLQLELMTLMPEAEEEPALLLSGLCRVELELEVAIVEPEDSGLKMEEFGRDDDDEPEFALVVDVAVLACVEVGTLLPSVTVFPLLP